MAHDTNVIYDGEWLPVPDVMDFTGRSLAEVRAWLDERDLIGMRRGPHNAVMVPELFLTPEGPLASLRGTISALTDSGLSDDEILRWLGARDDTLAGGTAVDALRAGHKSEIRRRAQELAF